jgi:hypothetical protein
MAEQVAASAYVYTLPALGVIALTCRGQGLWPLQLKRFRGSALCMISQAVSAGTRLCWLTGRNVRWSCRGAGSVPGEIEPVVPAQERWRAEGLKT